MQADRTFPFADFIILLLKFEKKETNHLRKPDGKDIYRPLLNCIIVFAVLSGLFFSNAEGVRLLPFPDCSAAASLTGESGQASFCGTQTAPAVRRTAARHSANLKAKKSQRPELDAVAAIPARVACVTKWSAIPVKFSSPGWEPVFSSFSDSQSSRGPPSA
jgi:hypothetical protein